MPCHDEAAEHGHGHGHDHGAAAVELSLASGAVDLFQYIDLDRLVVLNAEDETALAGVFRPAAHRQTYPERAVVSDYEDSLLVTIPFRSSVRLYALLLLGPSVASEAVRDPVRAQPRRVEVYRNRDDLTLSTAARTRPDAAVEFPAIPATEQAPQRVAVTRFNGTDSVTLLLPEGEATHGSGQTVVFYIGLWGFPCEGALRRVPVGVSYEAAANPADHARTRTRTGDAGYQIV